MVMAVTVNVDRIYYALSEYRSRVIRRTIFFALTLVVAFVSSVLAKEPKLSDFPLVAHIESCEKGTGAVMTFLTFNSHGAILHLRIDKTGYVVTAANGANAFAVPVGQNFPARLRGKSTIELLLPAGKNGKLEALAYKIKGRIE